MFDAYLILSDDLVREQLDEALKNGDEEFTVHVADDIHPYDLETPIVPPSPNQDFMSGSDTEESECHLESPKIPNQPPCEFLLQKSTKIVGKILYLVNVWK